MPQVLRNAQKGLYPEGMLFAFFIALSLAVRIVGLGEQSVWGDEYCSGIGYLQAESFSQFLDLLRMHGDYPILSSLLYFLWAQVFSASLFSLRLFSVFMGGATVALFYLLARKNLRRTSAFFALFLLALSPAHVWQSQSLRPYPLLVLLVTFSVYCWQGMDSRKRWWIFALFSNTLIVMTHWLAFFFVIALSMLVFSQKRYSLKSKAFWALGHAVLLGPYLAWVLFYADRIALLSESQPFNLHVLVNFFSDRTLHGLLLLFPGGLAGVDLILLFGLFLLAVLCGIFSHLTTASLRPIPAPASVFSPVLRALNGIFSQDSPQYFLLYALVLLIFFAAATLLGTNLLAARYIVFLLPVRYLFTAKILDAIPFRPVRIGAILIVAALYLSGFFQMQSTPTRTQWKAVAAHIEAHGAESDIICVDSVLSGSLFALNHPANKHPLYWCQNEQVVVDTATLLTRASKPAKPLWYVSSLAWDADERCEWSSLPLLEAHGFRCASEYFPAMDGLLLIKVDTNTVEPRSATQEKPQGLEDVLNKGFPESLDAALRRPLSELALYRRLYDLTPGLQPMGTDVGLMLFLADQSKAAWMVSAYGNRNPLDVYWIALMQSLLLEYESREEPRPEPLPNLACVRLLAPYRKALRAIDWRELKNQAALLLAAGHPWGPILFQLACRKATPTLAPAPYGLCPLQAEPFLDAFRLNTAASSIPASPLLAFNLGEIYDIRGQRIRARECYEAAGIYQQLIAEKAPDT